MELKTYYDFAQDPGDDCQTLTKEDISTCYDAVEACKRTVDEICRKEVNP